MGVGQHSCRGEAQARPGAGTPGHRPAHLSAQVGEKQKGGLGFNEERTLSNRGKKEIPILVSKFQVAEKIPMKETERSEFRLRKHLCSRLPPPLTAPRVPWADEKLPLISTQR